MKTRPFGKTGFQTTEIGHGTWSMGSMWGAQDDKEAIKALVRSLELGVNFIDTAFVYGNGHSEQLIAKAFKQTKKKVFVASKVPPKNFSWPASHSIPVDQVFPADHIIEYTETSLKNLNTDCLDLQQLHVWSDSWMNTGDFLEAAYKLKKDGKIRFFGVSINDHEPNSALEIVQSGLIDSVQVIYNIFDQSPEEKLFPLCLEKNVAVIVRVPFDEGSLTGTLSTNTHFTKGDWRKNYFTPSRLAQTCERIEKLKTLLNAPIATLPQLALKFCLSHPAVSNVIPGMRTLPHVESNLAVSDLRDLTSTELVQLKNHKWLRNFYQRESTEAPQNNR